MNINDWKTIQLQNDVKYIKRNSIRSSAANWSLVVDVFLLLLAFVLDNIFSESTEQTYNLVWIVIAFLGVLIPIIITVVEFIKLKHHERISRIIMNSKDIVSMFDDEICYLIMSAETFYTNLKELTTKIHDRQNALLAEFYFIETEYYLNKSVNLILRMENNLSSVIDEADITKSRISKRRLNNSINLIACIYEELFSLEALFSSDNTKNKLVAYCIILNKDKMIERYNSLRRFANDNNSLIGINMSSVFRLSEDDLATFCFEKIKSKLQNTKSSQN